MWSVLQLFTSKAGFRAEGLVNHSWGQGLCLHLEILIVQCAVLTIQINYGTEDQEFFVLFCFLKFWKPRLLYGISKLNLILKLIILHTICLWVCFPSQTTCFLKDRINFPFLCNTLPWPWEVLKINYSRDIQAQLMILVGMEDIPRCYYLCDRY